GRRDGGSRPRGGAAAARPHGDGRRRLATARQPRAGGYRLRTPRLPTRAGLSQRRGRPSRARPVEGERRLRRGGRRGGGRARGRALAALARRRGGARSLFGEGRARARVTLSGARLAGATSSRSSSREADPRGYAQVPFVQVWPVPHA